MEQHDFDTSAKTREYLAQAAKACSSGDVALGLHLYMAAYEESKKLGTPTDEAINGLRVAWTLANNAGERSLAELIFEKLEPHLDNDEKDRFASELQNLAFDQLEEFGIPRPELDQLADMVEQSIASFTIPLPSRKQKEEKEDETPDIKFVEAPFTYKDLVGYTHAIREARALGIGRDQVPGYDGFIQMLNSRHGLTHTPPADTYVFRSPAREDASRFMDATLGELDLSAMRMRIEENVHGVPMLCMLAPKDGTLHFDHKRNEFKGSGALILEDLDLWIMPTFDTEDEFSYFMMAQLSRGAREALGLIHSAVQNPDIQVMVSMSSEGALDPFFEELLGEVTFIDIDLPTADERAEIWMDIANHHPSTRAIDRAQLVKLTDHMARCDIYAAASEAIDQTYKESLKSGRYAPVSRQMLFEKIANYQPLDSDEYKQLEDAIVVDFGYRLGLAELEEQYIDDYERNRIGDTL